ncbi:MAG: hypothetical protein H0W83_05530 [Planctomycetes bacterium]|nr:hypothetical protein [Planctomycetota bacterium]
MDDGQAGRRPFWQGRALRPPPVYPIALALLCAASIWSAEPAVAPGASDQGVIDTAFSYSRIWIGHELWPFAVTGQSTFAGSEDPKRWQELPGVISSFRHSGTGPLPAPQEFVVTLDKTLAYGPSYRLFVKNFYLGKMEAVVSDVTRPVEIKRFDWSPGAVFEPNAGFDRIVLRYFPTDIVADTGVKQEQHHIVQGVFLTTDANQVPIQAGEILQTIPVEVPPSRPGNHLDNGSFEVGLFPWGKPFGASAAYGVENLDTTTAAEGRCSFKRRMERPSGMLMHRETSSTPVQSARSTCSFAMARARRRSPSDTGWSTTGARSFPPEALTFRSTSMLAGSRCCCPAAGRGSSACCSRPARARRRWCTPSCRRIRIWSRRTSGAPSGSTPSSRTSSWRSSSVPM